MGHDQRHALRDGGSGYACILNSLKYHRADPACVIRLEGDQRPEVVEPMIEAFEREGLFSEPNPVTVLVAPTAVCYRALAGDLIDASADRWGVDATIPRRVVAGPCAMVEPA